LFLLAPKEVIAALSENSCYFGLIYPRANMLFCTAKCSDLASAFSLWLLNLVKQAQNYGL